MLAPTRPWRRSSTPSSASSSPKRGRVFRLLLRLLPARGLRAVARPVHREGQSINEHIEQMRLSATKSLMERRDVVIVATGVVHLRHRRPETYHAMILHLREGASDRPARPHPAPRRRCSTSATTWTRFRRGTFRVRGDVIDIFPGRARRDRGAHRDVRRRDRAPARCSTRSPATSAEDRPLHRVPSSHYVTPRARRCCRRSRRSRRSCASARSSSRTAGKLVEASASSSAPASTSRCSTSWASARASRTTRGTCRARSGRAAADADRLPAAPTR